MALSIACADAPAFGERLVISDVNLLSMDAEVGDGVRTVVVDAGRIVEVASRPGLELYRRGDVLLRGDRLWLLPGLIDSAVVAVDPADLRLLALAGVTSVVHESAAAKAWLEPLVALEAARLPSIFGPEALPTESASEPARSVGSALAVLDAPSRWSLEGRPDELLSMLDPATAARWRGGDVADFAGTVPSGPALARRALLMSKPWVVASRSGERFMAPQRATVDEMTALRDAGFDPQRILRAATVDAADRLGRDDLGRVRAGAIADLLLLEADPRVDLSALRRVRAVVLRGELLRAAEIESTHGLLIELREEQAALLNAARAPRGPEALDRRWLLRFDGLPRGVRHSTASRSGDDSGWLCVDRTVIWSPLHSTLEIATHRDRDGVAHRIEVRFEAPGDTLIASLHRRTDAWKVVIERDGSRSEWLLPNPRPVPTKPAQLTADRAAPGAEGTPLCEMWPSTFDLRLLGEHLPTAIPVAELAYGTGSPRWQRVRIVASRAADARAPLAAIERSLRSSPWVDDATAFVVLAFGPLPESSGWLRRLQELVAPPTQLAGAYAVDSEGWPILGRFLVPEGLWEFHPLDVSGAEPQTSPPGPTSP